MAYGKYQTLKRMKAVLFGLEVAGAQPAVQHRYSRMWLKPLDCFEFASNDDQIDVVHPFLFSCPIYIFVTPDHCSIIQTIAAEALAKHGIVSF
jgi:hypothetical protein